MIIGVLTHQITQNAYRDDDLESFLCVLRLGARVYRRLSPSHDRGLHDVLRQKVPCP